MTREFGDFQTPLPLVGQIVTHLKKRGVTWGRMLEPTCGMGNFIVGAVNGGLVSPGGEIHAVEIQPHYIAQTRNSFNLLPSHASLMLEQKSIFDVHTGRDLRWRSDGPLLVLGNPPWVTNSELGGLDSLNQPARQNPHRLRGLDAQTGASNFDLAEAILLKLIVELQGEHPTFAMLCKSIVARQILQLAARRALPIQSAALYQIDARKWFRASVEACLFTFQMGETFTMEAMDCYASLEADTPAYRLTFNDNAMLVHQAAQFQGVQIEGRSPLEWRQGIKHDAASLMELRIGPDEMLFNKGGEQVAVEADYVYPLLKSTDLHHRAVAATDKRVIVTQRYLGENTATLRTAAPRLWAYLTRHESIFQARKSSIYAGKPPFSMFGIGDYSFSQYKVAVSALHRSMRFSAILPLDGRPVMLDDTCYFVSCADLEQSVLLAALLNSTVCQQGVQSMTFTGTKRVITKSVLQRLDLLAAFNYVNADEMNSLIADQIALHFPVHPPHIEWPADREALFGKQSVQLDLFSG